jgi:large subunit ribosomal protein L15
MELHNLRPAQGAVKARKRIARGQGAGSGGTATRGHKGAKSRAGHSTKRNFEGGQMPLQMRLPKRGFTNPNRVSFVPLNVERLQVISEKFNTNDLSLKSLIEFNIIGKNDKVKILGRGELKAKLSVEAHAVSGTAKAAIEGAGGSITLV